MDTTGVTIPFPIIADPTLNIARKFCMVSPAVSDTVTVRNVFIIDDKQIVRAILTYPLQTGRNIPEIFRLAVALQTADREKAATPANWVPGQPLIVPAPKTYNELVERVQNQEGMECVSWYLCYKNK